MVALLGFLFIVVADILAVMFRGFVLTYLWSWFLTPFGLPVIGIALALGISLTVRFLTYDYNKVKDDDDEKQTRFERTLLSVFTSVFFSLVAWGMGAIFAHFL